MLAANNDAAAVHQDKFLSARKNSSMFIVRFFFLNWIHRAVPNTNSKARMIMEMSSADIAIINLLVG